MYQYLLRMSDVLADAVLVNCAAIRDQLVSKYSIPEARIHLCYNGIDTKTFSFRSARAESQIIIGGVYALRPEKDLETLLDAFARVHAKHAETRLLIVGSGAVESKLRQRARVLGIESICRFHPSSADVTKWFHEIDIFVLPSRSEALSNSLMEAMACGCACIASRVGGNPELVQDGKTGLLFSSGDAQDLALQIETLVLNPEMRVRLASTAAARIRTEFSIESAARRMGEIYGDLVSSAAR
jgi:glycosyltransferase involved in cell wall biosynthesis